jgi:hypothetical protein
MFGAQHAADLRALAREIDLATARPNRKSTGAFAAAALVLNPLEHVHFLIGLATAGHIMAQPWFVRWLTQGFKEGTMKNLSQAASMVKAMLLIKSVGFSHGDMLGYDNNVMQQQVQKLAPQTEAQQ